MASEAVTCARCGTPTTQNHAAKKAGKPCGCRDCRYADPEFFKALLTGVPLVERVAS